MDAVRAPATWAGRDRRLGHGLHLAEPARPDARRGDRAEREVRSAGDGHRAAAGNPGCRKRSRSAAMSTRSRRSSRTPATCRPMSRSRRKKTGANKPVKAEIALGEGGEIVSGTQEQEIGHLQGARTSTTCSRGRAPSASSPAPSPSGSSASPEEVRSRSMQAQPKPAPQPQLSPSVNNTSKRSAGCKPCDHIDPIN